MADGFPELDVTSLRGRRAVHRWERTSVGDVFERLTWSYPDKTALIGHPGSFADERYRRVSYRQADETANRVANALLARGLEPGARVLLYCENSVEALLAKVGIAKAGMVAMPVNPSLAVDVLAYLVDQAQPAVAIVDDVLWPRAEPVLAATGVPVLATIRIGGDDPKLRSRPDAPSFSELVDAAGKEEPTVVIHGDDIWQLLYTSGTTSMPKGVMLSHNASHFAAFNFALSLSRGVRLECDLRIGAFLPIIYHVGDQCFTISAFLSGGTLVIGRKPVAADIADALESEAITALWAGSPQLVQGIVDELDQSPRAVRTLQVLVYGWGAIPPRTYERLRHHAGDDLVMMGIFGQTEAIACHRFWPLKWPELYERTAPALNYVGVPSPVLASDVLDEDGKSVRDRPGVHGEAVYRSPTVTAGYYLDEAATREAFRGGWFHSGDVCTIDEDGLRIMVDRWKDIVKSGGENVSSIRVEAVLHQHAGVARAAVIGLPHDRWGEAVTAVVVPRPSSTPTESELIEHCRERLAGYESPKGVIFVDALPETVGGKVLKYKLRQEHADHFSVDH
jgi:acyl-CoA synthetase (AMP-forming)/AMP-acid ligase II